MYVLQKYSDPNGVKPAGRMVLNLISLTGSVGVSNTGVLLTPSI